MLMPMLRKLLLSHFKNSHITLFFLLIFPFNVLSQSIELGDIVVVSVNSGLESTLDVIPLINLEKGTEINLTNKRWDDKSKEFYDEGEILKYTLETDIEKGSVYRFSDLMDLDPLQDHIYIYTEDQESIGLIYGIYWDSKPNRIFRRSKAEEVTAVLKDENAFVELSNSGNHQYFVKNGASGTKNMLLSFVSEPAHWNSKDETFSLFGTSFQLLKAPVVQFDEVRSTFDERKKEIVVNVAIYEHDGSELYVAVRFDENASTLSDEELNTQQIKWFNFEGLKGSAVFDMKFQIHDDDEYEETELAVFMLDSLSKGSYGDFRFHNSFLRDDDLPKVEIVSLVSIPSNQTIGDANFDGVINSKDDQYVIIQNKEKVNVNIRGWKVNSPKTAHEFINDVILEPNDIVTLFGGGRPDSILFTNRKVFTASEGGLNLSAKGGKVRLFNERGNLVTEKSYAANLVEEEESETIVSRVSTVNSSPVAELSKIQIDGVQVSASEEIQTIDLKLPEEEGWHLLPTNLLEYIPQLESQIYYWSIDSLNYQLAQQINYSVNPVSLIFVNESIADSLKNRTYAMDEVTIDDNFEWLISFRDQNENEFMDPAESINPLSNPTNTPISSSSLINYLSEVLLIEKDHLEIYINNPKMGHNNLLEANANDLIQPFSTFWLKSDEFLEESLVNVNLERLLNYANTDELIDEPLESGKFGFEFSSDSVSTNFSITFIQSDSIIVEKNLESLKILEVFENGIDVYGMINGESISAISIPYNFDELIEIPLELYSDEAYELDLKVSEWQDLPFGVRIQLVDLNRGDLIEFDEDLDMRLDFDYFEKAEFFESDLPQNIKREYGRYLLRILPEGYIDPNEETELPEELELYQNYPNPFNPITTISFYLPESNEVKLAVYNVVGQPVATLISGELSAGEHQVEWDATQRPSGIYIYQLEVGNKIMTRKMTLVK